MQNSQHFQLDTPQTLALRLGAGDMVHVTQGCIWLTLEGHARDVWLNAHDSWSLPVGATVWFSADSAAAFTVSSQAAPPRAVDASRPEARIPAHWAPA